MVIQEAKSDGYKQMIIECQNNNVPACKFYHKQGALLSKIDMYASYHMLQFLIKQIINRMKGIILKKKVIIRLLKNIKNYWVYQK